MSFKEIFAVPKVILILALFISCVIVALSMVTEDIPLEITCGAAVTAAIFAGLVSYTVSFPIMYKSVLDRTGAEGTATILKKEKHSDALITPDYITSTTSIHITFEFTPEGRSAPLQLTAEVKRVTSTMQEGKTMKIVYAKSNPRIVKLPGE